MGTPRKLAGDWMAGRLEELLELDEVANQALIELGDFNVRKPWHVLRSVATLAATMGKIAVIHREIYNEVKRHNRRRGGIDDNGDS